MNIGVMGVNHKLAPIKIREIFNFSESQKIEASSILQEDIDEIVILSTCNRSEIYYASSRPGAQKVIKEFYCDYFGFSQAEAYLFSLEGPEAVSHTYKVAAGLDSIVIGEDQILGQIKEAMEFAMELKFSQKVLNRLFQSALAVGKKVRSQIGISTIPLSTSYIGIKMVQEDLKGLGGKSALVIGAGEMSELSISYLYEAGLDHIYVTNRSDGRLDGLFETFPKLEKLAYKDRYAYMAKVDLLITATAAVHRVVELEDFPLLEKNLHILDLGLPMDVDPRIGDMDMVSLYSLDDLESKSMENEQERKNRADQAQDLIGQDVDEFMAWLNKTQVDPILSSLNQKKYQIEVDAVNYLNRKLDLSSREQRITEEVISYVLNRITREAVLSVKENPKDQVYQETVAELFNLEL